MAPAGQAGQLSRRERELLLDLTQLALDVVGLFEPTPFADAANVAISLGRRDLSGALLSGLGMVPYVGDLAKAARLAKYRRTVDEAIAVARRQPELAGPIRAALQRILDAVDGVPVQRLPRQLREPLLDLRGSITAFLAAG